MKRAAIGIRAHSGWGALVVIAGSPSRLDVIDRRRITIMDPKVMGAKQPYHFVRQQDLVDAERHLAECAVVSERLAFAGLTGVVQGMKDNDYVAVGCAILLASGRALPELSQILGSHSQIHAAEGEFFRSAFRKAAERLQLKVEGFPERKLEQCADAAFGTRAPAVRREIAAFGKRIGPPWTNDQRSSSLAALLLLTANV